MARGKRYADSDYINESKYEKRYKEEQERRVPLENNIDNGAEDDAYYEEYDDYDERIRKIRIVCAVVVVVLIIIIAAIIANGNFKTEKEENITDANTTVEPENLISTYENYKVIGKIKIDKIDVEQYILDSKEEDALNKGITKLYGGSLNSEGNLSLAGHNFDEMFGRLNELDRGDTITLVSMDLSEKEYEVKEILSVDPTDLEVLVSEEGKVQITLITCENASTERLIIKAEEK